MKTKAVPSGWLGQDGRRLDCGPYMSGALEAKVLLESTKALEKGSNSPSSYWFWGGPSGISSNAGRIKRIVGRSDERHGLPFLSSTDILKADLSNLAASSAKQAAAFEPEASR